QMRSLGLAYVPRCPRGREQDGVDGMRRDLGCGGFMETKPQRVPLEVDNPMPKPPPPDASAVSAAGPTPVGAAEACLGPVDVGEIEEKIIAALRTCYDPEIPVNIYE